MMDKTMLKANYANATRFVNENETYNTSFEREEEDAKTLRHLNILLVDLKRHRISFQFHTRTAWERLLELVRNEQLANIVNS